MSQHLFKNILFATDMSDNAQHAAQYAVQLAHENNAHLRIVNVVADEIEEMSVSMRYDLNAHYGNERLDAIRNSAIDKGKKVLTERIQSVCNKIIDSIDDCSLQPDITVRAGETVEQIINEAKANNADLIVVGARGHGLLDEILIGSVARGVVKKSPVPVLTIPLS